MTTATTTDDYYNSIYQLYFQGYFARKGIEAKLGENDEFWMVPLAKKIEEEHADAHPIHPDNNTGKYSTLLGFILFLMTERNG